ncbi:MAG: di-trans,poly-cis-decaprenylcistransferase [Clostridia bacterium]|nr:di-trans,poly-cis-decaprenylcistransferase [Clostridia bacterium]
MPCNVPAHIAFIMDGNGRWAKKRGLARTAGHVQGAKTFKTIVEGCFNLGIRAVTVYAFSTENWKRPKDEVDTIMNLMQQYIGDRLSVEDTRYKIRFIGDSSVFDVETSEKMQKLQSLNPDADYTLYIALNYGGRAEICYAVNTLIAEGKTIITEDDISSRIYTSESPDPDLIVRTGGDVRISNFLMWQSAYSELWFTKTLWPDITMTEVKEIIFSYGGRERRFGGLGQ